MSSAASRDGPAVPPLIVLGPSPPPTHGQAVAISMLAASLQRAGLLAARVDTRDPRPLETLTRFDFENVRLGLLHAWRLWRELGRHPDAGVYIPLSQHHWALLREALWAALARLRGRRPLYLHAFGGRQAWQRENGGRLTAVLVRRLFRSASLIFVETPNVAASLATVIDPARVRVLPNFVGDPGPAEDLPGGAEAHGAGARRILFLSNLREGKGYDDLLAAVAILGERLAGWEVRLVGEVDERTRSGIEVRLSGLAAAGARVELVGPRFDQRKQIELRSATIFVLPTRYRNEGQPLALLEAMAAGLPIVSTRYRGIPDTVADGEEALLVEPGDIEALAGAIGRLASDSDLRSRLAAAARARYERNHRPERLDAELPALLGSVKDC